jgi:hypothetical protein
VQEATTLFMSVKIAPEDFPEDQNRKYLRARIQNERERPNMTIETIVPARQNKRTGLRPTWSDRRFQWNVVTT